MTALLSATARCPVVSALCPTPGLALLRASGDTCLEATVCVEGLAAALLLLRADIPNSNINLRDLHLNVCLLLMLQILVILSYNIFLE